MFGILLVFCLVVLDVFEMVKKRLSLKYFKTYIVCGFLFLPYATTTFLNLVSGRTYYKLQNPGTQTVDLRNIYFAIDFLSGSNLIYICLLVAGVAIAVSNKKSLKEDDDILRKAGCYSVILMLLIIGISFILSVLFKTSYMKERYFICLIPYSTFIITKAAKFIYNETAFLKKISLSALAFSIITAFFLNTNYLVKTEQLKVNQPFREVAEYLTSKADFYSSDVAIMVCGRDPMRFGWQYYLSKDFEYQDREILSWSNNKDKESLTKYKKIYIFYPYSISDGFKTFLNNLGFKQSDFNTSLRLLTYEKSK